MSPGISEDPFALTQREERRGPCLFLDPPRCHRPKRQRNHQRHLSASSRSVSFQRELLGIERVALQLARGARHAGKHPPARSHAPAPLGAAEIHHSEAQETTDHRPRHRGRLTSMRRNPRQSTFTPQMGRHRHGGSGSPPVDSSMRSGSWAWSTGEYGGDGRSCDPAASRRRSTNDDERVDGVVRFGSHRSLSRCFHGIVRRPLLRGKHHDSALSPSANFDAPPSATSASEAKTAS